MDQLAYDKTYELEKWYWWYVGRRFVISKLLKRFFPGRDGKLIADIGCGTGGMIELLQEHGQVVGLDVEQRALDFCRSNGFENVQLMPDAYQTGLAGSSVDLVTMFDVLEHVEDDIRGLKEVNRVLKADGYIFLTVPAYRILWSELDEYAHHYRRYKRIELEDKLKRAGFKIIKSSYIFFFTFPLVFVYRIIRNFSEKNYKPKFTYVKFPWMIDRGLVLLSKLETWMLKYLRFPVGSSVIIFAKKVNETN